MAALEVISTDTVSARRKMRFWNEAVTNAVSIPAEAEPLDRHRFGGVLRRLDLDCFRLVEISGGASHVQRLPSRDRRAPLDLQLALEGHMGFRLKGQAQTVSPGDFVLCEPTCGTELELPAPVKVLSVCVPREELLRYMSCPEVVVARVMTAQDGCAAMVSRYLRDLWANIQSGMRADTAVRLTRIGVELLASAYADIPDARTGSSCLVVRRRAQIQAFIEENLTSPGLTPTTVAHAMGMTPSYMHRLFYGGSESVAQYILRRRLAECHRVLSDPLRRGVSVSSVAMDHGFNSLSHFSRTFRARYGVTPRQVRCTPARGRHDTVGPSGCECDSG